MKIRNEVWKRVLSLSTDLDEERERLHEQWENGNKSDNDDISAWLEDIEHAVDTLNDLTQEPE